MELEVSAIVITIVVVCLYLWRISYGASQGLFVEAAGLVSILASYVAIYYITKIVGETLTMNFGKVIPMVGYLVLSFLIYKIMFAISDKFRQVKEIPILGSLNRLLGMVLGVLEATAIILLVEYVTDIEIIKPVTEVWSLLYNYIKSLINN